MLCQCGRSFCERQYFPTGVRNFADPISPVVTPNNGNRTDVFHDDAGGGAKLLNQVIKVHGGLLSDE